MNYTYYLFDLDGVLINSTHIHHSSLKQAIFETCNYNIDEGFTEVQENNIFKSSLTSKSKLKYLLEKNIINENQIEIICDLKNKIANNKFNEIHRDENKMKIFNLLKKNRKKIGIVTNTNKKTASLILEKLGLLEYIDLLVSNNDVINNKPHVEPYMKAIVYFNGILKEYIIFEDSEDGIKSAEQTGCKIIKIDDKNSVDNFFQPFVNKVHFRIECVLCKNNSKLVPNKTINEVAYHLTNNDGEYDLTYGYCKTCYSVQLMTLLDPEIIYDGNKNILPCSNTYNWIQHNISFIQFIISSINTRESLIEIGSSSFVLGKHLIDYYKDYSVFDISLKSCEKRENVKYIEGNCENYEFNKGSNLMMSHVFEHLYEPKKFIENCHKNSVENIIISIPNMNDENIFHITNQHTFLYNDSDIEYIFSLYNYKCMKKHFFNANDVSFPCIFFHFQLNREKELANPFRVINECRHSFMMNILNKEINVPENTFIATSGMFSNLLFGLIVEKKNIIGIIDQNENLHGKIFANTGLQFYPYEHLKTFDESANIIVSHPRKIDIINCIRKVNEKINIIVI